MFVSRGDRDLGVAFLMHPGSQSLSRGEAKDSTLLSSCDGYLLEPTEWPKGSQASCALKPSPVEKKQVNNSRQWKCSRYVSECGSHTVTSRLCFF